MGTLASRRSSPVWRSAPHRASGPELYRGMPALLLHLLRESCAIEVEAVRVSPSGEAHVRAMNSGQRRHLGFVEQALRSPVVVGAHYHSS